MITDQRKTQLLTWYPIYKEQGCSFHQALIHMQVVDQEEIDLVCALWGETAIDKINKILGFEDKGG